MSQFAGYIGNTPVPRGTKIITQGTFASNQNYLSIPHGYTVGAISVYIDGNRLNQTEYDASDGLTIIFNDPATSGNRTYPAGTKYLIEELSQFELPNIAAYITPVSSANNQHAIIYTADLWNSAIVNPTLININDIFCSAFFNSAKVTGSCGSWQVINLTSVPPDGTAGLNTDGKIYIPNSGTHIQLTNISTTCSPLQYGKTLPLIKELHTVVGGFDNQTMSITGFWTPGDQGGGLFFWSNNKNKSAHNGSTVIDPDKISSLGSGPTIPSAYTTPSTTGTGCWVRVYTGTIMSEWLGGI